MLTYNARSLRKSTLTRLTVERMEDRYMPAFYMVTGLTDATGLSPTAGDGSLADPYQIASLRSAVEQANLSPDDDTIALSTETYTLTDTTNYDLNIADATTAGKLTISGAGEAVTTIQASFGTPGSEGRLFGVAGDADLTLTNMTLTGGNAYIGGAILAYGGSVGTNLAFTDVTLTGNQASGFGGAIAVIGAYSGNITATLTNVTIEQNIAGFAGGGVVVMYGGSVVISNSSISSNTTTAGYGGGIGVYGDYGGTLDISNSTVSGNTAGYGGGIAIFYDQDGATTLTNTTVSGNTAEIGGGIALINAAPTAPLNLVNSTVSGNTADYGGGIVFGFGNGSLTNSTVTANTGYGGGLANFGSSDTFAIRNTIVAGNFDPNGTTPDDLLADSGTPFIATYSLIGVGDGGVLDPNSANNLTGTLANPLDPRLGALANNGGLTLTHALLADSPARNAGDPDTTGLPATDQRGTTRVLGNRVDIGSVEAQTITISPATLPAGTAGSPYTATLTASGATGPFAYTVTAGALPPGLTLSPTGELTGTPTAAGSYTFTIGVTGADMSAGSLEFSLTVASAGTPPTTPPKFALGAGSNGRIQIAGGDGTMIPAFNGFQGEVRVATADLNGDGVLDVIAGVGAGSAGGHVKVFDGATGAEIRSFFAFSGYAGGVYVSSGDINGDGVADLIIGAGAGALGGHVKVFDGKTGDLIRSFFAFDGFAGGARVASGDVNGDGADDIIVGAGAGASGGHVKVYDGRTGTLIRSFFAFSGSASGVFVGAADLDGDGTAEIVVGADAGADPQVRVYGNANQPLLTFMAYAPTFRGGVRVAGFDVNGDGRDEIITGSGFGAPGDGRVFDSNGLLLSSQIVPDVLTGIFVG